MSHTRRRLAGAVTAVVTVVAAIATLQHPAAAATAGISKISIAVTAGPADGHSWHPVVSDSGRFVAYASGATNLVADDTNNSWDVFLNDRTTGQTRRISVAADGTQGNSASYGPTITADGRYVLFYSYASNLIPGDTNDLNDLFLFDTRTQSLRRIDALAGDGSNRFYDLSAARISADGTSVVVSPTASLLPADTNTDNDVYVLGRTGRIELVSVSSAGVPGNGASFGASISETGRYVAFLSYATNLVSGDTNGVADLFLHDRQTGATRRVSLTSSGRQFTQYSDPYPAISADGRYVSFSSSESTVIPGDVGGDSDVFVRDMRTGRTTGVSVTPTGGDARVNYSADPSITSDGRYVAFRSLSGDLVAGDTNNDYDVFVRDLRTGRTQLVSASPAGQPGDGSSYMASLSTNGRHLAFVSAATNLVPGDSDGPPANPGDEVFPFEDVFVRDR